MTLPKTKQEKPTRSLLANRSLSITQQDTNTLNRIAQDASDYTGWTVSGSAIVRALLRCADYQGGGWVRAHLFPLVEQEIYGGTG